MSASQPKLNYIIDETGRRSAVILDIEDYEKLMSAWEEVADTQDFRAARESAAEFISIDELRKQVLGS